MLYRNVVSGREVERPGPDEWLDASRGWERVGVEPETGEEKGDE